MHEKYHVNALFDEILARLIPTLEERRQMLAEPVSGDEANQIVLNYTTSAERRFVVMQSTHLTRFLQNYIRVVQAELLPALHITDAALGDGAYIRKYMHLWEQELHTYSPVLCFAMGRLAKENDWTPREGMGYLRRLVKNPAQRGLRNVVATIYRRLGENTDARRQFHASLLVRRRIFSMLEQVCLLQIAQGYHTPQGTL